MIEGGQGSLSKNAFSGGREAFSGGHESYSSGNQQKGVDSALQMRSFIGSSAGAHTPQNGPQSSSGTHQNQQPPGANNATMNSNILN